MSVNESVCASFLLCCQIGTLCGQKSLKDLPGCWEHQLDDDWLLSFNGHMHEVVNSGGHPVPAMTVVLQHSGALAMAIIAPSGGIVLGFPEDAMIEILESAIRKLGGTPATEDTQCKQ